MKGHLSASQGWKCSSVSLAAYHQGGSTSGMERKALPGVSNTTALSYHKTTSPKKLLLFLKDTDVLHSAFISRRPF